MRLKGVEFATMTQRLCYSSDSGPYTYDSLMSSVGHLSQTSEYEGPYVDMSSRQGIP